MLTRIFKSGNSQAVRIPKDLNFDSDIQEVEIERKKDALIIRPQRKRSLAGLMDRFAAFPTDFMMEGREFHQEHERGTL
ncbi:MAG: type II toxin-antitoxin system VapB family antitoxin [Candidatus Competibacteraceae bacterium]|jgi:antitoxin VapB